jgi:two-component system, cell cycle sensor histidine kinase and response regulator CckA
MSYELNGGAPDGSSDNGSPRLDPLTVLVVEDDDMVRWSTARLLRRAGYEVLEAASVEEALICMQEDGERVTLVLSDVIMPKQTGYDLGQAVRERWPETEIVLMSGYTPVAMDRHGIGTTDFHLLRKPINDLAGVVAELIGPAVSS